MPRKHLSLTVRLISGLAVLAAARTGRAQTVESAGVLPVYADVNTTSGDAATSAFAWKLLEFGVGSISGVQMRSQTSPCAVLARVANAAQQRLPASEIDGSRFAVVRLTLEEHRPEGRGVSDWLLDYEVSQGQWAGPRATCGEPVLRQTQRTTQARLLDTLTVVSRLMASAVTPWVPTNLTAVALTVTGGDQIRDELSAYLTSRIAGARGFMPVSPSQAGGAAYALVVDVGTTPGLLRVFQASEVSAKLTLRGKNAAATTTQVARRPSDQLVEFYRAVADVAIRQLYEARAASELSLSSTKLEGVSDTQLLSQARSLLCVDADAGSCAPRPDDALAVLRRLSKDAAPSTQILRGRAQLAAGQHAAAGVTFDSVANSPAAEPVQQLEALELSGDAHAAARQYTEAAGRYGQWLGLAPGAGASGPRVSVVAVKRARALRVGHAFEEAVESLFQALTWWPDATGVDAELTSLVPDLTKEQLQSVVTRLAAVPQPSRFRTVRVQALRGIASRNVETGAFADAERALTSAVPDDGSRQTTVDLGWLYYRWAMAAGADMRRQLLERGIAIATPAVRSRVGGADGTLLSLNHELGNDVGTKDEFERAASANPNDADALLSVMLVCTEYLMDFSCAGRAADRLARLSGTRDDIVRQLSIAEVQILNKDFASAAPILAALRALPARSKDYRYVQLFYAAWIDFATGQRETGARAINDWRREMDALRQSNLEFSWIFRGARRALDGLTQMSAADAAYLRSMIEVMEDGRRPLPPAYRS
jgi:tetratricopeptide (TPR) repeat protein